ncbi:MAG: hypothetical protein AAF383_05690 [Cyanobacteria bacterium P01_A01_bin.83]
MIKIHYYNLPKLKNLYFEDSYVIDIQQNDKYIEFLIEAVLTEHHPLDNPPLPNEQYCYKNVRLIFSGFDKAIWIEKNHTYHVDINGEIDQGNIDGFYKFNSYFYLEGEWGKIKILGAATSIDLQI